MIGNPFLNIKIEVSGPEQSKAVQKVLFSHGCGWAFYKKKEPIHTDRCYLCVDGAGFIQYATKLDSFRLISAKEMTASEIMSYGKGRQVEKLISNQKVNNMDIKKLLAEIQSKKKLKEEIIRFIEKGYCGTQTISVNKWYSCGDRAARVENITIPKDQMHRILQGQVDEIDAFLSKYQPLIDTFNAAIKGVGND